ncbi:MAG: helix-turn-helix domain-containing protein [Actinomycetota bacterium]
MNHGQQEAVALHRWGVIAEAANARLAPAERGAAVRAIAARAHLHPDGTERRYSRGTIDRWIRAWRASGLDALRPSERADVGAVRAHPELFAEAREGRCAGWRVDAGRGSGVPNRVSCARG